MLTDKNYEELEKKYGKYSSWALWNLDPAEGKQHYKQVGFQTFESKINDPNFRKTHIKTSAIILNTNWSSGGKTHQKNWQDFHNTELSHGHDYTLAKLFLNTPFEGCYITDIIKSFPETNSNKVLQYVKNPKNIGKLKESAEMFSDELAIIQPQRLIVLGKNTLDILKYMQNKQNLIDISNLQVSEFDHFSKVQSKEKFQNEHEAIVKL